MDNKKLFYISGFFSIFLYISIFILMLFYFVENQEILKKFNIKQKSVEVSLIEPQKIKKIETKKIKKTGPKEKIEAKKTKKRVGSLSPKEEIDISKLFSTIKTSKKKTIKKKAKPIKKRTPPSRFKGESLRKKESAKEILKKMNIKDVSRVLAKASIESVEGENDPYMSKVYEILYKYWLPSQESAGNRAKVKIMIDSSGNFDYKVLLFSPSEIFNKELIEYLEYLKTKKFPIPKEGYKEITVYFEAKE
ncbi:TonB C-terminal domain-containing protein [Nitrosophilus kaiyonis]|uniref:TonB C-terminal domain-containing protein n=1 Tax=Nitrosophilus kaiyonis TaxID=2930200 RepID=UPI002490C65A|nr:TonB C-terminal domain-containing protein [Nitrosophilus kaiyonis]